MTLLTGLQLASNGQRYALTNTCLFSQERIRCIFCFIKHKFDAGTAGTHSLPVLQLLVCALTFYLFYANPRVEQIISCKLCVRLFFLTYYTIQTVKSCGLECNRITITINIH